MSDVNRNELKRLVGKYLDGTATEEERVALERYYDLFDAAPEMTDLLDDSRLQSLEARMKGAISRKVRGREVRFYRQVYFRRFTVAAAIGAMVIGLAWVWRGNIGDPQHVAEQAASPVSTTGQHTVNRFLKLPDGSTVVLHGNSRLELSEGFNKTGRVVSLTGEAYFDVAHRADVPFVIHTGKVKTTVLGTSFNIRAWPGQKDITVSVSRGKVRVEDESRLIAVLTQDKQVVYNTETAVAGKPQEEATEAIAWVQEDMTFDEMPFAVLANHLGERYGIRFTFVNPDLEACPITGRFSGTENLEEVLRILSATSNTRYSLNGQEVRIEGEKCL